MTANVSGTHQSALVTPNEMTTASMMSATMLREERHGDPSHSLGRDPAKNQYQQQYGCSRLDTDQNQPLPPLTTVRETAD